MTELISSASNPIAKRIRALADRKARRREGVFLVEGMQPVWRAAESGWEIETLILAPELIQNPAVEQLANDVQQRGTRVVNLSAELFTRLSDRDGPAGVMAIVHMQTGDLRNVRVGEQDSWLVLHRVHNPGNLGTIIRTADAAGITGVILSGDSTDPFAPAAVKASMGSIFSLPIVIERDADKLLHWASEQRIHLVGASGSAEAAHWDISLPHPLALVLGNEGDGLPGDLLEKLDSTVRIPMTGTAESLNLGVAAALLMYEVQRHKIV